MASEHLGFAQHWKSHLCHAGQSRNTFGVKHASEQITTNKEGSLTHLWKAKMPLAKEVAIMGRIDSSSQEANTTNDIKSNGGAGNPVCPLMQLNGFKICW
jgi:hypothetical protein